VKQVTIFNLSVKSNNQLVEPSANYKFATIIKRENGPDDAEFYTYDSNGERVRKVFERYKGDDLIEIEEKIYLGAIEIKRIKQKQGNSAPTKIFERTSLHIMDDKDRIALSHNWIQDDNSRETDILNKNKTRFQYGNHLGSASLELDNSGLIISYEEYFPYGGTSFIAGKSQKEIKLKEYRYTGKERDDSTGLYYYGARYYAPWLGRWMSADPLGAEGSGLNMYWFASGNPINRIDLDGMADEKVETVKKDVDVETNDEDTLSIELPEQESESSSGTETKKATIKDGKISHDDIESKIFKNIEHGKLSEVNAIVLHQTGGSGVKGDFEKYKSKKGKKSSAAHFYIDQDGTIYQTASLDKKTWHIGKIRSKAWEERKETPMGKTDKIEINKLRKLSSSKKITYGKFVKQLFNYELKKKYGDRFPINSDSLGIEIVSKYDSETKKFEKPTKEQTESLELLLDILVKHFKLDRSEDIYRHSDISYKNPDEAQSVKWKSK